MSIKNTIILVSCFSFLLGQEIFLTQQAHVHGGTAYLVNTDESSEDHAFHGITVGQAVVGHAESNYYSMDFGFWSFYLKEPDAIIVSATDGDPSTNGVGLTFKVDPLSPPVTLTDPPDNISSSELGGYASTNQVSDHVVAVTKSSDGSTSTTLVNTETDHSMTPSDAYSWTQDVRPGIMYSFGVTGFNSFGLTPEGTDVGFTLANGRVEGVVTVPGSMPGTTGNGVKDVEVRLNRADGQSIGSSLYLDGNDDYLYASNIYDELIDDDLSVELWFKNPANPYKEYLIDMNPMLSVYQQNNYIYAVIGSDSVIVSSSALTSYMTDWHHLALTKGSRGACIRNSEPLAACDLVEYTSDEACTSAGGTWTSTDTNNNGQWDAGEIYQDWNQNSFYDPAGPLTNVDELECVSSFADAGENFVWHSDYYASGVRIYLNGSLVDSTDITENTGTGQTIHIGRSKDGGNWYNGFLDDMRIWGHARTEKEILTNKGRFLTGKEAGLLGYWKMDAGMLDKAYNLVKYEEIIDYFPVMVGNDLTLWGSNDNSFPWWVNDSPMQYISSFTDEFGTYSIKNIAYDATGWDGTQFNITPYKENHDYFDPPGRTAYIRLDYYEHHNMNFTDNSLFAVTGSVYYKDFEACTIDSAEVQIKYLGDQNFHSTDPVTYTDSNGSFRIDVEPEKTFAIQAVYKDHIFPQTFSYYNITSNKVNNFENQTTNKTLYGEVSAGICESENEDGINIGPYTIQYADINECIDEEVSASTTTFSINNLPPLEYNVKILPDNGDVVLVEDILVANLDDYNQESVLAGQEENALEYKYYPPIRVDIVKASERTIDESTGETTYTELIPDCNDGSYIFEQGKDYSTFFKVKEDYLYVPQNACNVFSEEETCIGSTDDDCEWFEESCRSSIRYVGECLMENFKINVLDNITVHTIDEMLIEAGPDGEVEYFFTARSPNIIGNLISGPDGIIGNEDDIPQDGFKQYIRIDGLDSDETIDRLGENYLHAYINGTKEDPDQINVNTSTSTIPFFVLRDPPGDASYSYLSEEQQVCQTMSLSESTGVDGEYGGTISAGADFSCNVGVSVFGATFSTSLDVDVTADAGYGFSYSNNSTSTTESENCFTVSSTYSTSDDENFTGASGDIFVGSGLSVTFSKAIDQDTQVDADGECIVSQGMTYIYGVDGLVNTYMHTQSFLENTMIPQLEAQASLDASYQEQADYWKYLIALNDSSKTAAVPANYDLLSADPGGESSQTVIDWSAGTIYEFSKTSESTFSSSHEFEYSEADELNSTFGVNVNGVGFEAGSSVAFTSGNSGGTSESTTSGKTNGFVFADDDPGDHFLVEIKEDPIWGMPVYELIGGQSECPWEIPTMKRYDPILQVAGPDLQFGDIALVNQVGEDNAAELSFKIVNNSPTLESKDYMFRLLNESNSSGALVTLNGQPMTSPFQISVDAPTEYMGCEYSALCQAGDETPCGTCGDDGEVSCAVDTINGNVADLSQCQSGGAGYNWESMYMPAVSEATVYVRKDEASNEFNYEDLTFEQYPECAAGDPEQTYSTSVSVSFESPCTNVSLEAVGFGSDVDWHINGSDEQELQVRITDFTFVDQTTNTAENLNNIFIEYAESGTENWISFPEASVGYEDLSQTGGLTNYEFNLDMSNFPEEIGGTGYKLRAVAFCSVSNKSYSNVIEGIIDTETPNAYQIEPADNVLSGGDEISISYDETLDCDFINQAVFTHQNMTLSSPNASGDVFSLLPTCIDNKVVLNIDASVAPYTVENDTIRIEASNVRDLLGNINSDSHVWEFFFNQNPISWSEPKIEDNIYIDDNVTITTTLQNIGGSTSTFEFGERNDIPEWLSIDPMQGWLNSQGQTEITFTLDPYMDIGPVYEIIYAENSSGDEPIVLDLEILCRPPAWEYDDSDFQYSMQVVGQLAVDNIHSTDTFDRVVATVNGEVRGVAQLEEFTNDDGTDTSYRVYLSIHGNGSDIGEEVKFRIWDNDNCRELWNVSLDQPEPVFYNNNVSLGSFSNPEIINAVDLSTAQHIDLNAGWSWISLNLSSDDDGMLINNALSYLSPSSGDQIVGPIDSDSGEGYQLAYSQYSDNSSTWEGSLDLLNNHSMYHIYLSEEDNLTFVGLEVDPDTEDIEYVTGWNWISYIPQNPMVINDALINLTNVASQSDFIKDKHGGIAEYVDGYGWIGTLTHMHPGQGYMFKSATDGYFNYPGNNSGGGDLVRSSKDTDDSIEDRLKLYSTISLDPYKYQYSMSIISDILVSDEFLNEHNLDDLSIIAYVDDEARGIAKLQTFVDIDKELFFISVHGDNYGEKVYFRVYDELTKEEFLTNLEFNFEKDEIFGSVYDPMTLSGVAPVIPDNYELSQNYPNPFNPTTRIDFQIPEDSHVDISIFNIRGQRVAVLKSEFMEAGYGSLLWNGTENSGITLPTGIYFIKMEAANYVMTRKMVLLK